MLAFSIDYYGIFFGATQSVELFCTYFLTDYDSEEESYGYANQPCSSAGEDQTMGRTDPELSEPSQRDGC